MLFTKNIVFDVIKTYRGTMYIPAEDTRSFRWVAMLPEDTGEMETDLLYVCRLSQGMARSRAYPQRYNYLCIRDCITDEEDAEVLNGIFVVDEKRDVSWLFNLVQQRFLELNRWWTDMQTALISGGGYQQLMDLCEPILNNGVYVLDNSYTLLAHTKNIVSDEPMIRFLLENGYHSAETIQKFKDVKRFGAYEQHPNEPMVSQPSSISQYEVVTQWCRFQGQALLQVVMVCSRTPLSRGQVELFKALMANIELFFAKEQKSNPSQFYHSLLVDMLYNGLSNAFIIADRAKTSDVPFSGHFTAWRIVFEDNSVVLVGRFVQELSALLPRAKLVAHNYEISVLNSYPNAQAAARAFDDAEALEQLLGKYGGVCGVSELFETLPGFLDACDQATKAHSLGRRMRSLAEQWALGGEVRSLLGRRSARGVYFYEDVWPYMMLYRAQAGSYNVFLNAPCISMLRQLQRCDAENHTQLMQVLYVYLLSERRGTAAGKLLHMHRNNVLYHVTRIEELLNVDLNDYWTRLKLTLAFHFLELEESNQRFIHPGSAD